MRPNDLAEWSAWQLADMHRQLCAEMSRRQMIWRRKSRTAEHLDRLTPREHRAIEQLFQGLNIRDSARELKAARGTIKNLRHSAYRKLGVDSEHELIARAYREGGLQLWTYTGAAQEQIWRPGDPEPEEMAPKFETAAERRQWLRARQAGKEPGCQR